VAHGAQAGRNLAEALRGPAKRRLRIAAGVRLDQSAQIDEQARIGLDQGLAAAAGRRTRSASSSSPLASSASARPIVLRATPVARDAATIPPRPAVSASAAANRRRPRSSSTGASASKRWRMADSSIT